MKTRKTNNLLATAIAVVMLSGCNYQKPTATIVRTPIATNIPVVEMGADTTMAEEIEFLSAEELLFP